MRRVIHGGQLRRNAEVVAAAVGGAERVIAVVKADAYGHGLRIAVPHYRAAGVRRFAVSTVDEALSLAPIVDGDCETIVIGWWSAADLDRAEGADQIVLSISTRRQVQLLVEAPPRRCVIEVDIGMHRTGLSAEVTRADVVRLRRAGHRIVGLSGHVGTPPPDQQRRALAELANLWRDVNADGAMDCSVASSRFVSGRDLLGFPSCRVGQLLTGATDYELDGVAPAMSLVAGSVSTRSVPAGHLLSYSDQPARRNLEVAVIPAGYADGVPEGLADGWSGRLSDRACGVLAVDMNWSMVDVTTVPRLERSGEIEVISSDPNQPHSLLAAARHLRCYPDQLTVRLARIPAIERP